MSTMRLVSFLMRSLFMGMVAAIFLFLFFPDLLAPVISNEEKSPPELVTTYSDVIEQVADSVVNIRKFNIAEQNRFQNRATLSITGGSGVIVSATGYIVTNYHVIAGAEELTIELNDGRATIAEVVGFDAASDLAVLKINLDNLSFLPMQAELPVTAGDVVFAVGYPFGVGQVATMGIVSGMGKNFRVAEYEDYILTDSLSISGNSGGPLVSAKGELLGIVSSRLSTSGYSFAISTDLAMDIVEQIVANGRVVRGWLGFEGAPVDKTARDKYGESSYVVIGITEAGPADKAGMMPEDIIVSIEGNPIETAISLRKRIASYKPGSTVQMGVIRNEVAITLSLVVQERPTSINIPPATLNR
ncbi:MAG: trypsin-like peptidase domain-containing protein [Gammaproteobacteria bacterium]|nr:trypsin-like peptidase domain-containing protein [Gammaproteobacteria bacterium]NNJ73463.1 PDZ domain-containing protein [Enterobacterales bacterium]